MISNFNKIYFKNNLIFYLRLIKLNNFIFLIYVKIIVFVCLYINEDDVSYY